MLLRWNRKWLLEKVQSVVRNSFPMKVWSLYSHESQDNLSYFRLLIQLEKQVFQVVLPFQVALSHARNAKMKECLTIVAMMS